MRDFAVVDVETSGLDFDTDQILEIAVLRVDPEDYTELGYFEAKLKPDVLVSADAAAINGYDEELWKREAKPLERVMLEFNALIDGAVWMGCNPRFDLAFISNTWRRARYALPGLGDYHLVDVSSLAYPLKQAGIVDSVSLQRLAGFFGLPTQEHRALSDCRLALEVYRRLAGWMIQTAHRSRR